MVSRMRTGRQTQDKKDSTLKLRLNDKMRSWVERRAGEQTISMSEFIRILIEDDMTSKKFPKNQKDTH